MTVIVQDDHLTAGASVACGGCSMSLSWQNSSFDFVGTILVLSASADRPKLTNCRRNWRSGNLSILKVVNISLTRFLTDTNRPLYLSSEQDHGSHGSQLLFRERRVANQELPKNKISVLQQKTISYLIRTQLKRKASWTILPNRHLVLRETQFHNIMCPFKVNLKARN